MKAKVVICLIFLFVMVGGASASVVFDGKTWYHSHDPSKVTLTAGGALRWVPRKPHQLTVNLVPQSLAAIGSSVTLTYLWQSRGDYLGCDCHQNLICNFDDDVTCLAGTGDFRIGLFDSNGKGYVTGDLYGEKNDLFKGYLGYQWRFHPHICDSERFIEVKPDGSTESHTNVSCWKRNQPYIEPCSEELLGDCDPRSWTRIKDPVPACFALPFDTWGEFVFKVERVSSTQLKTTFSFNGLSFSVTDSTTTYQPANIDVFAIHFPNARPYDYVILARPAPAADFTGDCMVDGRDLKVLCNNWLGSAPDNNGLLLWYKFDESSGSTAYDSSGRGLNGNVLGAKNWVAAGKEDRCLRFNDDTCVNPPTTTLGGIDNEVTFSVWLKGASAGGWDNWVFDIGNSPYLNAKVPDSSGNVVWHASGDTLTWATSTPADWFGSWVHYGLVKNAATGFMAIYRNGRKVADRTGAYNNMTAIRNTTFDIGAKISHAYDYIGDMDEFRVYDYALSDPEIAYIANGGSPANLYEDDIIDFKDLAEFARYWLYSCQ